MTASANEMVERVARALAKAANQHTDDDLWRAWLVEARAAIAAMREPTTEMGKAWTHHGEWELHESEEVWRWMIDEALR